MEPTYDLNAAAAKGGLIKTGRVTDLIEVDSPGSGLFTSEGFRQIASRCEDICG